MITRIAESFDFEDGFTGYTIEDNLPVSTGEKIKVYIPYLMPNINKDSPQKFKSVLKGLTFVNDKDCRPISSNKITTRNYTYARKKYNSTLNRIYKRQNGKSVIIPKNTKVSCKLTSNRLSDISFDT